jgi:hypothetical protein
MILLQVPGETSGLTDEVRQQHVAIGQHESKLKAVMDHNVKLREQHEKNNGLSEKFRKSMENERCLSNRFQAKKSKAHNQKLEIRKLQDQLKQAPKKKTQIASLNSSQTSLPRHWALYLVSPTNCRDV